MDSTVGEQDVRRVHEGGGLLARPSEPSLQGARGLQPLGLGNGRDGLLYVPASYQSTNPAPLVLMLHGAGGNARHSLAPLQGLADEAGLLLLAPESRRATWDIIQAGRYGPDVAFIDRALEYTFDHYAVDRGAIAVEGFSDGASYALSLGIGNGDLFSHIIAFSPGFMAPRRQEGAPLLFVSHGVRDDVLPVVRCSRQIVPQLERAGYDVRYHEFDGGHRVPPSIAEEAVGWFLADRE